MPAPRRILLLLGDAHLRDIFALRLEEDGWETELATDFTEAERKAVRFRPEVMLMDAQVVEDIPQALKRCASLPTLHHARIVVYGKGLSPTAIHEALDAGAADVVLSDHTPPRVLQKRLASLL